MEYADMQAQLSAIHDELSGTIHLIKTSRTPFGQREIENMLEAQSHINLARWHIKQHTNRILSHQAMKGKQP